MAKKETKPAKKSITVKDLKTKKDPKGGILYSEGTADRTGTRK